MSISPFFSIGVTTYNRKEMLRQCLFSILQQTFSDFEVIVGNDYAPETLSSELLGINDSRIRFVNYPLNLGEMKNMNALLAMSCGRYFTWLADDDMYAAVYLEAAHAALERFNFPRCVFTSYIQGDTFLDRVENPERRVKVFQGREFLYRYLSHNLKVIGNYGIFDVSYLRQIGGREPLGKGLGLGADTLLAIRAGLLEKVIYIDAPLVFFRTHAHSLSWASPDVEIYSSAYRDLLDKSTKVFMNERLKDDFYCNLYCLLRWCISDYCIVMERSRILQWRKLMRYLIFLSRYIKQLRNYRFRSIVTTMLCVYRLIFYRLLTKITKIRKKIFKVLWQDKNTESHQDSKFIIKGNLTE